MEYNCNSCYYDDEPDYQYDYEYNDPDDEGEDEPCCRSVSLPKDCYNRFQSYKPQQPITQRNFMKVVQIIMNGPNSTDADISEAFQILDADGSGKLSVSELSKVIPAIMPGADFDTLSTIIRRYDKNYDNQLDFNEFSRLVRHGIGRDVVYRDRFRN